MSSRVERAQKQTKEKHQSILNELLREDANRFCADCEAKGLLTFFTFGFALSNLKYTDRFTKDHWRKPSTNTKSLKPYFVNDVFLLQDQDGHLGT